MTQGINEQIGTLPAIEAELHLFEVGRKMLGANPVPRPHDAALEEREGGFNRVGVNVSHDVDAGTVVNLFVVRPLGFPHSRVVRGCVIGEDYFHVLTDILADVLRERSAFGVSGMEEAEIAVPLADADYHFFVIHPADAAFAPVPAADVSNVHLYFAIEHGLICLCHCVTDAVTEIPCCLVAHSDRALNLAGRHALLRLAEQVRSQEPFREGQVRIVEYRAGSDGELIVTILAIEQVLLRLQLHDRPFAAQTLRTFRETQTNEQVTAFIFGREKSVYIN